jgi:NAD(P)-dependent dehydrogenase (short-subunit alcohol dehydrogenase family)
MNLAGKVALVTGGTMGIGAAIACELARRGANLSITARNLAEEAAATCRAIEACGRRCHAFKADVSKQEECERIVAETVAHFGRLDVLIHNAGGNAPGRIDEVSPEDWRYAMDVHVNANFYLARAALPHLKQHGEGCIVTVSSTAGIRGVPGALAYATAKGALPQFTRSLARELADDNIRVNCVAPGIIRTRFHEYMTPERRELNLRHRIPLHREGTPEQVAEAVALLVTNDYITGEVIVVDGGLTSRIV